MCTVANHSNNNVIDTEWIRLNIFWNPIVDNNLININHFNDLPSDT